MRNGSFANIAQYCDADQNLGKEALNTQIMNSSVFDGRRYLIPLRFDIPTILVDLERWEDLGEDAALLELDGVTLGKRLLAREDGGEVSVGLQLPSDMSLLPELFDYEKEEVLLTSQDIADYLRMYQAWVAASTGAAEAFLTEVNNYSIASVAAFYQERNIENGDPVEHVRTLSIYIDNMAVR